MKNSTPATTVISKKVVFVYNHISGETVERGELTDVEIDSMIKGFAQMKGMQVINKMEIHSRVVFIVTED